MISLAACSLRSSASPRLLRLRLRKIGFSPSTGNSLPREMSPTSFRSTLITSAPKSPSTWVQTGPISTWLKSRTRISSSGRVIWKLPLLAAFPDRLALLGERAGAFETVLGCALPQHLLIASVDCIGQRQAEAGHRRFLTGPDRERSALQDRLGPGV